MSSKCSAKLEVCLSVTQNCHKLHITCLKQRSWLDLLLFLKAANWRYLRCISLNLFPCCHDILLSAEKQDSKFIALKGEHVIPQNKEALFDPNCSVFHVI